MTRKKIDIEAAQDKVANAKLKLFGYSFTPTQLGLGLSLVGTVLGMLYGGFVTYQKIEALAGLDIEAFENRMNVIEDKAKSIDDNIYAIKEDLKGDIRRVSDIVDDIERDTKDDLRNFRLDIKEVEDRLNDKMQKFLDNPLSGNG
jgi:DNA-binding ferritin-like protein (Dps family)